MARLLSGKEAAAAMNARLLERSGALQAQGVTPKLVTLRCGENPSDLAYERGAEARAGLTGVTLEKRVFPEDVEQRVLLEAIDQINGDPSVHGCLLFRPLPGHLREGQSALFNRLLPGKDVDAMTDLSGAGVFLGKALGFTPCTPQACMEILDHYSIGCSGRRAAVIGRSLVVGRPAAMLLLGRDATVTVCHTRTADLPRITREADIIVTAAGALGSLTAEHVRPGQVVLDVSVNWDPNRPNAKGGLGAMTGDAVFEAVEPIVEAITPVPGGVGAVTTSVLMAHVIEAAERSLR